MAAGQRDISGKGDPSVQPTIDWQVTGSMIEMVGEEMSPRKPSQ